MGLGSVQKKELKSKLLPAAMQAKMSAISLEEMLDSLLNKSLNCSSKKKVHKKEDSRTRD